MPSRLLSLCLLLSCLAFVRAAPPPLAHLRNASLWALLSYDDWWVRLQSEVVRPLAATPLRPPPDLSARLGTDKVALKKVVGDPAFRWVRRELQCQLTFLSLVCGALASVYPELLGPARQRPSGPLDWRQQWSVPEMARDLERRLLLITSALQRNQTLAALELSTHAAMVLGWKWQDVHVTALADPAPAASGSAGNVRTKISPSSVDSGTSVASELGLCWDEVAVLNVLSDPDTWPDGNTLAALMHHGALADPWQSHLEDFFRGSREHAHPGATAGNTQLLPEAPAERTPDPQLGATVEWVLPADAFQDRVTMPSREEAKVFESSGFVAAGFPWYAQIIVDDIGNVSLAARMWEEHSLPAAGGHGLFRITLTAMREGRAEGGAGSPGGSDMAIRWLCEWDPSFGAFHTCAYPASLPLWRMLSGGTLPGFEAQGELLFRTAVESLQPKSDSCSGGSSSAVAGPLGGPPRLLASPVLRWAQHRADPRLWGTLGFASRRQPGGSAAAVDTRMRAAVAARFAPAPWLQGRLQAAAEELMSMDAGQATAWSWELPGMAGRLAEAIAATQLASAVGLLAFPLAAPLLHAVWKAYWRRRTRQRLASRIRQQVQAPVTPLEQPQPEQPTQDGRSPTGKRQRKQGQGQVRLRHRHSQSRAKQHAASLPAKALQEAGSDSSRASSAAGEVQSQASRSATPSREQPAPGTSTLTAAAAQPAVARAAPRAAGLQRAPTLHKPSPSAGKSAARGHKPGKQRVLNLSPPSALDQADTAAEQRKTLAGRQAAQELCQQASGEALHPAALPAAHEQVQQQLAAQAASEQALQSGEQRQLFQAGRQQEPAGAAAPVSAAADASPSPSPQPAAPPTAAVTQPWGRAAQGSLPSEHWVPPTPPRRQLARTSVPLQAAAAARQAYRPPMQPADLFRPQLAMPPASSSGANMAAPRFGSLLQEAAAEPTDAGQPGSSVHSHAPAIQSPVQLPSLQDAALSMLPAVPPSGSATGLPEAAPAAGQLAGQAQLAAMPTDDGAGGADLCVVCWEQPRQTVLVGCGHMALCRHCAHGLMQQAEPLCPICRHSVSLVQQVFVP